MTSFKSQLLLATVVAGGMASAAQAQIILPPAELRGNGATAVGTLHTGSMNCISRPLGVQANGTNTNLLITVVTPNYAPTTPSATNPALNCNIDPATASDQVQPNILGRYISTGSGLGRTWWSRFTNQLPGTTASNINPFVAQLGSPAWTNVQFGYSEGLPSTTELATYAANANNWSSSNTTGNLAGPAIVVPLYVLPVAIAFAQAYGDITNGGVTTPLNFNIRSTNVLKDAAGNPVGGIRLTKATYCGIFNGTILNWNNSLLQTNNGNQSYADIAGGDTLARWTSEGVPIRLVGRADNSGTSELFNRHLIAVCPSLLPTDNKWTGQGGTNAAPTQVPSGNLPYNTTGGPDIRPFLSSTQYFPNSSTVTNTNSFAGSTQSLSGAFYNLNTGLIQVAAGFTGEAPGLIMVANGNSGVQAAIADATVNTLRVSAMNPAIRLNGKVGYVSGEFVRPSPGATLFSAALQVGTSTTSFAGPTVANVTSAFGTVLPPQTTAGSGAWNPSGDTRGLSRANPRDWGLALYPTNGSPTLANPTKGYPISGPSFVLLYTCYAPDAGTNVPAKRLAIANQVGVLLSTVTKKSNNTSLSTNTFRGTGATSLGILTQQNVTVVPTAWRNAINETFLKRSTQAGTIGGVATTLGAQNLWIQSAQPTNLNQFDGIGTNDLLSNPVCASAPDRGA